MESAVQSRWRSLCDWGTVPTAERWSCSLIADLTCQSSVHVCFHYSSLPSRISSCLHSNLFVDALHSTTRSDGTIDYQGRQHRISFTLTPYYSSVPLSFSAAQRTLALFYRDTLLYVERDDKTTTGLDALEVRAAQTGFPEAADADPVVPIAGSGGGDPDRLSLDLEGLVLNGDGS